MMEWQFFDTIWNFRLRTADPSQKPTANLLYRNDFKRLIRIDDSATQATQHG